MQAKRFVAKDCSFDIETLRGTDAANPSDAKAELVEAKLEMVRLAGLAQHGAVVRRFCRLNHLDFV